MARNDFEYRLVWSGRTDTPSIHAVIASVSAFPLWKDSQSRLVGYEEYAKMVADGLIEPPTSYWNIEPGEIGAISLSHYAKYSNTWDLISTCKSDFQAGWDACEKGYQMLRDWDEAIEHEKARKDWARSMKRKFIIHLREDDSVHWSKVEELPLQHKHAVKCELKGRMDKEWFVVEAKCTGEELYQLMHDICYDNAWQQCQEMPVKP